MSLLDLKDWSLVPGPHVHAPSSSVDLHEVTLYAPELVAEAILAFPGMKLLRRADPTWWEWSARWEQSGRWIEVGITLFDTEPPAWGGSGLAGICELADVLDLWMAVRSRAPASWMHNTNCEIHSPESFKQAAVSVSVVVSGQRAP
jgi:hypothetical protein